MVLAAAAAILLAGVLIAAYFGLQRPYAVLFTNLRPADAATIVSELDQKKIPYRLAENGATILAPADQVDSTRLAVTGDDVPLKGTVGFELFNKSDMGLTEFAQRINYQRALQGELARTIMTMDTVDSARVNLALSEPSVFRDDVRPSKASVTVLPRPGMTIDSGTVRGIQRLVAAAVPDLVAGDVVVLNEHGDAVSGDGAVTGAISPQTQEKQAIEQYYAARIRQAIAPAFPGGADVTVTAATGPTPSSIDGNPAALDGWTPTTRAFPLEVSIALPTAPSADLSQRLRGLAANAAGLDTARSDALTIFAGGGSSDPPDVATAAPTPPTVAPPASLTRAPAASQSWLAWLLPALAILIGLAVYLPWRAARPRRLTKSQRDDLVRKLKSALDGEDAHAASTF